MSTLKIKSEYKTKVVSFGSYSGAAGKVTGNDLLDLAIIAVESKDPTLTRLFTKLPELEVLKKEKMDISLGRPTTPEPAAAPVELAPPAPSEVKEFAGKKKAEKGSKTPSNAPAAV